MNLRDGEDDGSSHKRKNKNAKRKILDGERPHTPTIDEDLPPTRDIVPKHVSCGNSEDDGRKPSAWAAALALSGTGIVLVCAIVVGYLAGSYLDERWKTQPWLTAAGVMLGSVAGFIEMFTTVRRYLK